MKAKVTLSTGTQPNPGRAVLSYLAGLLLISCASVNTLAQAEPNCPDRFVVVNVLDDRGVPVRNLWSENFRASRRGKSLPVLRSEYRQDPSGRVVVLLDVSASMSGRKSHNKWKLAHDAALEFVSSAPAQAQVSFIAFADKVTQRFEASAGRAPMVAWLKSEQVTTGQATKGRTALYDAIAEALKSFGTAQAGDAIYLISDGGDTVSKERSSQLEHMLEHSEIRLFAFLLNDSAPYDRGDSREISELTRRSGGFLMGTRAQSVGAGWLSLDAMYYYGKDTDKAIEGSTRAIEAQIISFYVLTIQAPSISGKLDGWDLEVLDAQGRKQKNVTAVYPQDLASGECVPQSP